MRAFVGFRKALARSIVNGKLSFKGDNASCNHARSTKRYLNVPEFGGMRILKEHGIPTPMNRLARSPSEAEAMTHEILESTKCGEVVLKALVLTGGRGKGKFVGTDISGVELAKSPERAKTLAEGMIGNVLVTKQTGASGLKCKEVLVAEKLNLAKERYISFMLDRSSCSIMAIATKHGGGNVEEVSEKDPSAVLTVKINPLKGITDDEVTKIATHLDFSKGLLEDTKSFVKNMYHAFVAKDALLLEINPLSETENSKLVACDSKVIIDDNADFRQKEIFESVPPAENELEARANEVGLNYISLGGNIACIVNGAGLAMATLDLLTHHGGSPSNFLDVGGNATGHMLNQALDIVASDAKAKALLVNIVGGIVQCDQFALSFVEAAKNSKMQIPVVLRLQGTNADAAKRILNEAQIPHIFCQDFDSAAKSVVEIANAS
ncbi:succinly CoA-ligase beta subunit family protein [Babesia bovis T2Bo]|uniref:Succinyl-CoA synthetase beta chain n=1 Tax=Babesia bovis TaxID=5865 RepID=A7AS83_BABBO|nr:succinly CoA-ligase beta subunit family protein [Babesia bovis T2Bo]EDO07402.1 succinly CoA-ligase beta subunit family protein [Babesia bovis T2Bo]BAN65554.1 succinly CoA-ligase beta subunit, putative [Babesia bovis]|eukprot:XP_001610970.1 succinly CoA-ligase beta subunit [Babesia bovis T2Bo]